MTETSPFETRRLFPSGTLTSGAGLTSWFWSIVATGALLAAFVCLSLLLGVVGTGGDRVLEPGEAAALVEALGKFAPKALVAESVPDIDASRSVVLRDAGVVPLMLRGDYVGPGWHIALVQNFAVLRNSHTAVPWLSIAAAVFLILHHVCELGLQRSTGDIARTASRRLRGSIHRQSLRLNLGDLDGRGRREAESLFIGQTRAIEGALGRIAFHVFRDPLRLALLVLCLVCLNVRLTLLVVLPIIGGWVFLESERRRSGADQKRAESRAMTALKMLSEGLGKSRLIRGYGLENRELEQFDRQLDTYSLQAALGNNSWRYRQRVSWTMAITVFAVVCYLVGMKVVFDNGFNVADGALFFMLLAMAVTTLYRGRGLSAEWSRTRTTSSQINRFLDRIPDVSQAVGAKFLNPVEQAIVYEGVTLRRGDQSLLENLELRLPAESQTAFVSVDPVDARSVAFLLPRFLEPESGRVLFDNEDIAWGTLESLRAECCYVGGTEPFFTGTVSENIAAGEEFSDNDILDAAKQCHVHKFITTLPDGYETVIGEHGHSVPPGEAFLLGLARAIVRNPAVLIIEEPDTPLDADLKALVEDAYHRVLNSRTVIFLPRRLSTVRHCDQVVLFEKGKVQAIGPQKDLVKSSELYRHWEYVTFSPFGRPQATSRVNEALQEFGREGIG